MVLGVFKKKKKKTLRVLNWGGLAFYNFFFSKCFGNGALLVFNYFFFGQKKPGNIKKN